MNHELPDVQAVFRKGIQYCKVKKNNKKIKKKKKEKAEEPEVKLQTSTGSSKKQESSRKTSTSALLTMPKALTKWITTNCVKFFMKWVYQTTLPAS